jgi:hypothetical protein
MRYLTTEGHPVYVRTRAEKNGVDRGLWDHGYQADADRDPLDDMYSVDAETANREAADEHEAIFGFRPAWGAR